MATRVEISSRQKFTDVGTIGVLLFLLGPVVSGFGYNSLIQTLSNQYFHADTTGSLVVVAVGAISFLAGCVLLLVGRTYDHTVSVLSEKPAQDGDAK